MSLYYNEVLTILHNLLNTALKMKNKQLCGHRMVVSAPVVYPGDHVADWQLLLTARGQHHKKVSYRISLAQEKTKIQISKHTFY